MKNKRNLDDKNIRLQLLFLAAKKCVGVSAIVTDAQVLLDFVDNRKATIKVDAPLEKTQPPKTGFNKELTVEESEAAALKVWMVNTLSLHKIAKNHKLHEGGSGVLCRPSEYDCEFIPPFQTPEIKRQAMDFLAKLKLDRVLSDKEQTKAENLGPFIPKDCSYSTKISLGGEERDKLASVYMESICKQTEEKPKKKKKAKAKGK